MNPSMWNRYYKSGNKAYGPTTLGSPPDTLPNVEGDLSHLSGSTSTDLPWATGHSLLSDTAIRYDSKLGGYPIYFWEAPASKAYYKAIETFEEDYYNVSPFVLTHPIPINSHLSVFADAPFWHYQLNKLHQPSWLLGDPSETKWCHCSGNGISGTRMHGWEVCSNSYNRWSIIKRAGSNCGFHATMYSSMWLDTLDGMLRLIVQDTGNSSKSLLNLIWRLLDPGCDMLVAGMCRLQCGETHMLGIFLSRESVKFVRFFFWFVSSWSCCSLFLSIWDALIKTDSLERACVVFSRQPLNLTTKLALWQLSLGLLKPLHGL